MSTYETIMKTRLGDLLDGSYGRDVADAAEAAIEALNDLSAEQVAAILRSAANHAAATASRLELAVNDRAAELDQLNDYDRAYWRGTDEERHYL